MTWIYKKIYDRQSPLKYHKAYNKYYKYYHKYYYNMQNLCGQLLNLCYNCSEDNERGISEIRELLDTGINPNCKSRIGDTISVQFKLGHFFQTVNECPECPEYINNEIPLNGYGDSCLTYACYNNNTHLLHYLIDELNVNVRTYDLKIACYYCNFENLVYVLRNCKEKINNSEYLFSVIGKKDHIKLFIDYKTTLKELNNCFVESALYSEEDTIYLFDKYMIDINHVYKGKTALINAIITSNNDLVEELIQYNPTNNTYPNIIEIAKSELNKEIYDMLSIEGGCIIRNGNCPSDT